MTHREKMFQKAHKIEQICYKVLIVMTGLWVFAITVPVLKDLIYG